MPRLAVLGYPVGHSRSPAMHNAALAALGMDEWSYEAIEVAPEDFAARVGVMVAEGFVGANVTIPHKAAALAIADVVMEVAGWAGAANTLSFTDKGIVAENTDYGGLFRSLPDELTDDDLKGRRVLVLGAGGAARAAVFLLVGSDAGEVAVWNRTPSRAEALCKDIGDATPVTAPKQGAYDLIVNTTAVGLRGEDPFEHLPLDPDRFDPRQVVVDMVYTERPSRLLAAAEAAGATTVDGLEILVQQGALSFETWTGRTPPLDVMRAAAREETRR